MRGARTSLGRAVAPQVRRRYRQFDALHAVLKLGYRNLPELPGKGGMSGGRGDQKFIDKRRDGLSAYLRALIADPVLAAILEP